MRHLLRLAALIGLAMTFGSSPVMATDQSAAVQICAKNPQCGMTRGVGGVNLWVDKPGGGGPDEVWCPDQGACVCMTCGKGGGRPARVGGDIGHVVRPQTNAPASLSEPVSASPPVSAPAPMPIPNFG